MSYDAQLDNLIIFRSISIAGAAFDIDGTAITAGAAELNYLDITAAGTAQASKALVLDASKGISTITTATITTLTCTNLDAGASGTAGTIDVFPATASKGKLALTCTAQTGNTTVTVNANAMGQATTINLPDPGAAASYLVQSTSALTLAEVDVLDGVIKGTASASKAVVLNAALGISGLAHIGSIGTLTMSAGSSTPAAVIRFGDTATEGLEVKVYENTVSPAAVETNLLNTPAGAVILSVQANCETALTGGSTTVTWSIGTAADPDKYGTAGNGAGDTLLQNGKLDKIPDWAVLGAAEQMVLTGCATGGTADGDTALTVGSVRARVVYLECNSLDNV